MAVFFKKKCKYYFTFWEKNIFAWSQTSVCVVSNKILDIFINTIINSYKILYILLKTKYTYIIKKLVKIKLGYCKFLK